MKNKALIKIIGIVGLFTLLCSWQGNPEPLPNIFSEKEERQVHITAKSMTSQESQKYLTKDLLSRGYQPVHVVIHNNTPTTYSIEHLDVEQKPASEIVMNITKEKLPRSVAYRVAGLIFWPFMIPSTIDGIKTLHSHSKLKKDFEAKTLKNESIIPFSQVSRVLFMDAEHNTDAINLTLYNQNTGKLEYQKVDLT